MGTPAGIVLAQLPDTAQYDGMPRSAIATGLVDYVGTIDSMPEMLVNYTAHVFGDKHARAGTPDLEEADLLRSVLAVVHARTKYDFRCYKKGTLKRRIARRMGLNQVATLGDYLRLLRERPDESDHLFRDLLIGVTGFFREPQAFENLEEVLARIIAAKQPDRPIRIWVPGCATGEEPYGIAMLVVEQLQAAQKVCPIQIFATDIDDAALTTARAGVYPENIAADVTAERLQRFFSYESNVYRVNKQLRDSVVFAAQNLISDPPFSKLDLVSCRNLLIYLEPEVQRKVINLFHFALNEDGYLFLGSAETIGQQDDLFEPVIKKWRLYRRTGPSRRNIVEFPIFPVSHEAGTARGAGRPLLADPVRLGEFTRVLLIDRFAPTSALIDRKHQILYYYGATEGYFSQPTGTPTDDLMMRVRDDLRIKLRSVLHHAVHSEDGVGATGEAVVHDDGALRRVRILATPLTGPTEAEGLLLVSFQEVPEETVAGAPGISETAGEDVMVQQLERELQAMRDDLQSSVEEMESSNEELKAANEEVMSVNEELQSTNEELETSKEELQSLNEELSTVNSQLEEKLRELEKTNDDLDNFLTSTDIATLFLNRELTIKRFTPATTRLFNLIATDLGRPVSDISRRFRDPDLLADARFVLERSTLLVTGDTLTESNREMAQFAGAILHKPIEPKALVVQLNRLLRI